MEIIDGNKLIAAFMGGIREVRHEGRNWFAWGSMKGRPPIYTDEDKLEYHKSWDWLMPVIENCHTIEAPTKEGWSKSERIEYRINHNDIWRNNITEVWKKVIEFIEWHNTEKITV